ncbi:hypothetical protein B0H14DRAFT_3891735 [Mycena olivaceomarginata]|nr:hypothetical protein B0H14DRAFT_3891735 [Mycena olivaceomarginata]
MPHQAIKPNKHNTAFCLAADLDPASTLPVRVHPRARNQLSQHHRLNAATDLAPPRADTAAPPATAAGQRGGRLLVSAASTTSNSGALCALAIPASPRQDVFVFEPRVRPRGRHTQPPSLDALEPLHAAGLPISVSLRAAVAAGRLRTSASPPRYAASYARGAFAGAGSAVGTGVGAGGEAPGELGGREAVGGAGEVVVAEGRSIEDAPRAPPADSFFSPIAYYTLDKDYHALIRRSQFAIGRAKIDVRREVEASAFCIWARRGCECEWGSVRRGVRRVFVIRRAPRERTCRHPLLRRTPTPCAADAPQRLACILPQLDARARSRWAWGQRRGRSGEAAPLVRKASGGGDDIEASVPLEFDEEDQVISSYRRARMRRSVASISTPARSAHLLDQDEQVAQMEQLDFGFEGDWAGNGWAAEDKQAVEEAERFHDISVVGSWMQAAMTVQVEAEAARRKESVASSRT